MLIIIITLLTVILTIVTYLVLKYILKDKNPFSNEVNVLLHKLTSGGQKVGIASDERGVGKTTLLTGIMAMTHKYLNDWQFAQMKEEVERLNGLGFNNIKMLETPSLIFSSYNKAYLDKDLTIQPNWFRPARLGLPDAGMEVGHYPNGSIFFASETEGDSDKRNWQDFNSDSQYSYDKQLRQFRQNVIMDMHNIDELERRSKRTFNLIYSPYKYEINGKPASSFFLKNTDKTKWSKKIKRITIHCRKYDVSVGGLTLMTYGYNGSIPTEKSLAKKVKNCRFKFKKLPIPLMFDSFMFENLKSQNKPYSDEQHLNVLTKNNRLKYIEMYGYGAQSKNATKQIKEQIDKLI